MNLSKQAQDIYAEISKKGAKLGDLRMIAKEIKKDQQLAEELWGTGKLMPGLLAILIFDTKAITPEVADVLLSDIDKQPDNDERLQLADWLMANQLMKYKKLIVLIQSWKNDAMPLKRRIFWYYQGRLRWTGQTPPGNTEDLLREIEEKLLTEAPEVQWAMNFTAAWIGIFDKGYRDQCIKMGEKLGLYVDEIVPRNCTPNYLPKFIEQEVTKRKL